MKQTDEGIIKNFYEVRIEELQTLITISYIISVAIGMLFSFQKYNRFGINIFDYADVFDFLITPFSDFKVLLFSFGSILMGLLIIKFDIYWLKKHPESYSKINMGMYKKEWFNPVRYTFYTVMLLSYLFVASNGYGNSAKKQIETNSEMIGVKFNDGDTKRGILIGKTSEYLFLKTEGEITAIPIRSMVKEIEIK
ncbi:hypothetical protein [Zobellia barbeyronii]|uniref:Preprotein translocase subunit YajC n=1 Tax=Zobellia barbeyronii TaxID=2748009 RepID=A0ABS5WIB2_9FLAO|nr:hypothetical protein [Zobellia barbeyronii]MBT2163146.1 hypothetical protein [Zobellia barbeyronii]